MTFQQIKSDPFLMKVSALFNLFSPESSECDSNRMNRKLHTDLAWYQSQLGAFERDYEFRHNLNLNKLMKDNPKLTFVKAEMQAKVMEEYVKFKLAKSLSKAISELINALKKEVAQNQLESQNF